MSGTAKGLGIIGVLLMMTPEQRRAERDLSRKIAGLELEIKEFEEEILKREEKIKQLQDIMTSDNPAPYTYELTFPEWIGPLEKLNAALYGDTSLSDIAKESHQSLSDLIEENKKIEPMTITVEDMVNANRCLFKGGCIV